MSITIHPPLETQLRARAQAEGLSVEVYLERLVRAESEALSEIEESAAEGLKSGEPIAVSPAYWHNKHQQLDRNLKKNS